MVFNATFNNISVISWWSVLLLEGTRVPDENHRPAVSDLQTLSHNVVSNTPHLSGVRTHNCTEQVVVNPSTIRSRPRWFPTCTFKCENKIRCNLNLALTLAWMQVPILIYNVSASKMIYIQTRYCWKPCPQER